jgi:hypothetical protein
MLRFESILNIRFDMKTLRSPALLQGIFMAAALLAPRCLVAAQAGEPGLTQHNGDLYHDGKPYRGIGVNYFSLFARLVKDPHDTSSLTGLADLARAQIPFARFMACGFWQDKDWNVTFDNDRAFMLTMIADANRRLGADGKSR